MKFIMFIRILKSKSFDNVKTMIITNKSWFCGKIHKNTNEKFPATKAESNIPDITEFKNNSNFIFTDEWVFILDRERVKVYKLSLQDIRAAVGNANPWAFSDDERY